MSVRVLLRREDAAAVAILKSAADTFLHEARLRPARHAPYRALNRRLGLRKSTAFPRTGRGIRKYPTST